MAFEERFVLGKVGSDVAHSALNVVFLFATPIISFIIEFGIHTKPV